MYGFQCIKDHAISFKEKVLNFVETNEVKQGREGLKAACHTTKLVACAILVISIAVACFGSMLGFWLGGGFGTFLTVSSLLIGSIAGILSFDVMTAADKGYQIASKAEKFLPFNYPNVLTTKIAVDQCKKLVIEMLAETRVLKHVHQFVFDRYWELLSQQMSFRQTLARG